VVSLATRAKFKNSDDLAQNGWFVGFTPRRNPDIVVCVLFQGGEHGRLAARLATQVIKAYVDKQRRQPTKLVAADKKVDIGAIWNSPGEDPRDDDFHGGHFEVDLGDKRLPLATAAPGVE
jgi:penicillin-binding protein 2